MYEDATCTQELKPNSLIPWERGQTEYTFYYSGIEKVPEFTAMAYSITPSASNLFKIDTDYQTYLTLSLQEAVPYDTIYTVCISVVISISEYPGYKHARKLNYYIQFPSTPAPVTVTYGPNNEAAIPGTRITLDLLEPFEENSQITISDLTVLTTDFVAMRFNYLDTNGDIQRWTPNSENRTAVTNKIWGSSSYDTTQSQFLVTFDIEGFGSLPVCFQPPEQQ